MCCKEVKGVQRRKKNNLFTDIALRCRTPRYLDRNGNYLTEKDVERIQLERYQRAVQAEEIYPFEISFEAYIQTYRDCKKAEEVVAYIRKELEEKCQERESTIFSPI